MPQDERAETITWRPSRMDRALIEGAAMVRGWPVARVLSEGAVQYALEICEDALRGLGKVRRERRRASARKAALARKRE